MNKIISTGLMIILIFTFGCIKDTYDLDKISEKARLSPSIALPAFKGKLILSDAVKESDTIVYDIDNFVKLVFRKDSAIDIQLKDYIDPEELLTFSNSYTVGEIEISPFQGSMNFTLDEVSRNFSTTLRNEIVALDDGASHPFPSFPPVNIGNKNFSVFPNFQYAVFSAGVLEVSVTNHFNAPLNNVQVILSTATGPFADITLPPVNPAQTNIFSIDMAGKQLLNVMNAAIILSGSPGNSTPGIIDLDQAITFSVSGRDLKVSSGRVIVPSQLASEPNSTDMISFNPGEGIELEELKLISGNFNWIASFNAQMDATLEITMPTVIREGEPYTQTFSLNNDSYSGFISLPNTIMDFKADPVQRFNKIPVNYSLRVTSDNILVDYNSSDKVEIKLEVEDPEFDYIKGYFGQRVEMSEKEIISSGIEDYMRNITGDIFLANPSVKIDYSNSFGIPVEIDFQGVGKKGDQTVNLQLDPFIVEYPVVPARDVSSTFRINKDNSHLAELISMPPESMEFSLSAKLNPAGDTDHLRNNYVFGNSRIIGSVEVELPLELSLANLVLSDTTDNFLKGEDFITNISDESIEPAGISLAVQNGFPFDVSVSISLYDPGTKKIVNTINVPDLIKAAGVDNAGKVNSTTGSVTTIVIPQDFIESIDKAEQIIFNFRSNTAGLPKAVKIYSDYTIEFSISVLLDASFEI